MEPISGLHEPVLPIGEEKTASPLLKKELFIIRRKEGEITDSHRIKTILKGARYLHLGLFDEEFPYVVPLHSGYCRKNGRLIFYAHCANRGHKRDCLRKNNRVFVEIDRALSLISADPPCGYGAEQECFMGRGSAAVVESSAEKPKALSLLMGEQTGRFFEISEKTAVGVTVLRFDPVCYTAKARMREKQPD